jgi:hypothetical protein
VRIYGMNRLYLKRKTKAQWTQSHLR